MKMIAKESESIPRLAWCANLFQQGELLVVCHGSWVEHGSDFFVEGAWNESFLPETIPKATICAATGCVLRNETAIFFSPTQTVSRLYAIRRDKQLYLSNSLPFLLVTTDEELSPGYIFYEDDFKSIVCGLSKAKASIPTASGSKVLLFYHCNVAVDASLSLRVQPKTEPPAFADFEAYRSFLVSGLNKLSVNARDPRRRVIYRPIATISRGYDSPACAALAREIGCEDAITFSDESNLLDPLLDSGDEIGRLLGMTVRMHQRDAYKQRSDFAEAEFLAAGTGGEDVFLSAAEDDLEQRLLITGFHGDKVWDRHNKTVGSDIVRGDASGADLEEFRLRLGFIHLPLPFCGCVRQSEIQAISNAPSMASWRLDTVYDRPIPRRLVEEAGIPRKIFGHQKRVMSRAIGNERQLHWYFSEQSYADFVAVARPLTDRFHISGAPGFHILHGWSIMLNELGVAVGRKSWRLGRIVAALQPRAGRYLAPADMKRFQFYWAISKMLMRYRGSKNRFRDYSVSTPE
jgi:hypothetical protein